MESTQTKHYNNLATCIHVSTFVKYLFPFGNFIAPLVLWIMNKDNSSYVDHHGKQALNFQLSMFCYQIVIIGITIITAITIGLQHFDFDDLFRWNSFSIHWDSDFHFQGPFLVSGILAIIYFLLFAYTVTYTVIAAIKANQGELYQYPLTIKFIK